MNRIVLIWIILLIIFVNTSLPFNSLYGSETILSTLTQQDTLKDNQNLYTGRVWINNYHRINGNQFLFADYFLPGTVSINGKIFKNLLIRYDIYSDEIMIPVNREEIVQLNKEMIDSFSITFENKARRFIMIPEDTLNGPKEFKGYFNVLYKQKSALYIKYKCDISTDITEKSDGEFLKTHKIYFVRDKIAYPVTTKTDLYEMLKDKNLQIKKFIKDNKLKVSKNNPESFVPLIRYYDSLIR